MPNTPPWDKYITGILLYHISIFLIFYWNEFIYRLIIFLDFYGKNCHFHICMYFSSCKKKTSIIFSKATMGQNEIEAAAQNAEEEIMLSFEQQSPRKNVGILIYFL